jgi:acyl-CoA thioester hydrolase
MEPIIRKIQYRIIYGDTDQMGVVYYGNYGRFYEMGRSEMVRELGFAYKELEDKGVVMPVYSVESRYRDVLTYDEVVTIETELRNPPAARIEFYHRIYKENGKLAHEAKVVLVFQNMETHQLVRAPQSLINVLESAHGA